MSGFLRACISHAILIVSIDPTGGVQSNRQPYTLDFYNVIAKACRTPELELPMLDCHEIAAKNLSTIHVAYASDLKSSEALLSSMLSVARNLESPGHCEMHLIVPKAEMAIFSAGIERFRSELADLPAIPSVSLHQLRTPGLNSSFMEGTPLQAFAKLYLHEYLPAVSRVIWLDHDTIVKSSVRPLFQMRMKHAIAAVAVNHGLKLRDYIGRQRHLGFLFKDYHVENQNLPALNAGVLVLDLDLWRLGPFTEAFERIAGNLHSEFHLKASSTDKEQVPLNFAIKGEYDVLDWRWNFMELGWLPLEPPKCSIDEARILHWAGAKREPLGGKPITTLYKLYADRPREFSRPYLVEEARPALC